MKLLLVIQRTERDGQIQPLGLERAGGHQYGRSHDGDAVISAVGGRTGSCSFRSTAARPRGDGDDGHVSQCAFARRFDGRAGRPCITVFHWIDDSGRAGATAGPWMPAGAVRPAMGAVHRARALGGARDLDLTGLKQGSDVLFAVLPFQAGTLIIADITALSLCIRPALGSPDCLPYILDTSAIGPGAEIGSDPATQYYRVNFNLSVARIGRAPFQRLNSDLDPGPRRRRVPPPSPTPRPPPRRSPASWSCAPPTRAASIRA